MARREVIELVCDRCGKKDLQEKAELLETAELEVNFRGKRYTYKDLCSRCREAVQGYFMRMTKQEEEPKKTEEKVESKPQMAVVEGKKGLLFNR